MANHIESLLVKNPDHQITDRHRQIITDGLAGCIAVGGVVFSSEKPQLFMSHKPDYDHRGQIEALSRMGLKTAEGRLFVFPKNPITVKGLYMVRPDGGKPINYSDAADSLEDVIRREFLGFEVHRLPYAEGRFPPHWSTVGISLADRRAFTDTNSISF